MRRRVQQQVTGKVGHDVDGEGNAAVIGLPIEPRSNISTIGRSPGRYQFDKRQDRVAYSNILQRQIQEKKMFQMEEKVREEEANRRANEYVMISDDPYKSVGKQKFREEYDEISKTKTGTYAPGFLSARCRVPSFHVYGYDIEAAQHDQERKEERKRKELAEEIGRRHVRRSYHKYGFGERQCHISDEEADRERDRMERRRRVPFHKSGFQDVSPQSRDVEQKINTTLFHKYGFQDYEDHVMHETTTDKREKLPNVPSLHVHGFERRSMDLPEDNTPGGPIPKGQKRSPPYGRYQRQHDVNSPGSSEMRKREYSAALTHQIREKEEYARRQAELEREIERLSVEYQKRVYPQHVV